MRVLILHEEGAVPFAEAVAALTPLTAPAPGVDGLERCRRRRTRGRRLRRRDRRTHRRRCPRRRPGPGGPAHLHPGGRRTGGARRSHPEMGGGGDYTWGDRTTPREVIHVSTPDTDTVRTAVQLDPDLAMAVWHGRRQPARSSEELLTADLHVRGGTMTVSGTPRPSTPPPRRRGPLRQARKGVEITPPRCADRSRSSTAPALTAEEVLGTDVLSRRGGMIRPRHSGRSGTSTRSTNTPSRSGWAPPAPESLPRHGQGRRRAARQGGQPHHPHRPAVEAGSGSAICPAPCTRRSTRTCGHCSTRCDMMDPRPSPSSWRPG